MKRILIGILSGLLFCSSYPARAAGDELAKADEFWKSRRNEAIVRQAYILRKQQYHVIIISKARLQLT